jgi:hypothetical protein
MHPSVDCAGRPCSRTSRHWGSPIYTPARLERTSRSPGSASPDLPAGTCLRIGEAVLEVTGDCAPCGLMDSIRPGLREAIRGQRAALTRVHQGGIISVADTVTIVPAPPS